jgi:hypothetical protein
LVLVGVDLSGGREVDSAIFIADVDLAVDKDGAETMVVAKFVACDGLTRSDASMYCFVTLSISSFTILMTVCFPTETGVLSSVEGDLSKGEVALIPPYNSYSARRIGILAQ